MKLPENSFLTFKQIAIGLIELDKQNGMVLKYENINSYIDRAISMTGLTVDDEDRKRLFHDIEYQYQIAHSEGHSIFDDYEDGVAGEYIYNFATYNSKNFIIEQDTNVGDDTVLTNSPINPYFQVLDLVFNSSSNLIVKAKLDNNYSIENEIYH